jgi:hypothetical protein
MKLKDCANAGENMAKIKTFVMIILTLTIFSMLQGGSQPGTSNNKVRAASTVLAISDVYNQNETAKTILVNVTVSDVTDLQLWSINITFNPQHLRITTGDPKGIEYPRRSKVRYNIYEGNFLKQLGTTGVIIRSDYGKINNTAGVLFGLACSTGGGGGTGSGVLAIINFTVVSVMRSEIQIVGSLLQDAKNKEKISHIRDNAIITYEPPPVPPIWSQIWFQGTVGGVVSIAGIAIFYKKVWKKIRMKRLVKLSREIQPIYEEKEPDVQL